jgi:DNA-binding NarL/FixJ family response regulator
MENDSVLTICSSPIFALGLRLALHESGRWRVAGEAKTAAEGLRLLGESRPNIAVLVAGGPLGDGLALLRDLHRLQAILPILVMGRAGDAEHVRRVLMAGGRGYLTQMDSVDELYRALGALAAGSVYFSHDAAEGLLIKIGAAASNDDAPDLGRLSDRELEVFGLIGLGHSSKDVAHRMGISVKTVETHRHRIKDKLGLKSGTALSQCAVRQVQRQAKQELAT